MSKEDGPSPTPVLEVHTPNDEKLIVHEDGSIIENDKIANLAQIGLKICRIMSSI